jgi:hypothetical protein
MQSLNILTEIPLSPEQRLLELGQRLAAVDRAQREVQAAEQRLSRSSRAEAVAAQDLYAITVASLRMLEGALSAGLEQGDPLARRLSPLWKAHRERLFVAGRVDHLPHGRAPLQHAVRSLCEALRQLGPLGEELAEDLGTLADAHAPLVATLVEAEDQLLAALEQRRLSRRALDSWALPTVGPG